MSILKKFNIFSCMHLGLLRLTNIIKINSNTPKLFYQARKNTKKDAQSFTSEELATIIKSEDNFPNCCVCKKTTLLIFKIMFLFGVRLSEIKYINITVEYDRNGQPINLLRIKNVNNFYQHMYKKYRYINYTNFDDTGKRLLADVMIYIVMPWNDSSKALSFENNLKQCEQHLSNYMEDLFPDRETQITLSTARHQFRENLKAMDCPKEEAAILMGLSVNSAYLKYFDKQHSGFKTQYLPKIF